MSHKINDMPIEPQAPTDIETAVKAEDMPPAQESVAGAEPAAMPLQKMFTDEQSSNVREISYDPESNEMSVTFKGGSKYLYAAVPVDVYQGALDAPSIGSYFASKIKRVYACEKAVD